MSTCRQSLRAGDPIGARRVITLPERPNKSYRRPSSASSQAVDVSTGTTRMQLALDNADGELMPGTTHGADEPDADSVPLSVRRAR